MPFDLQAIERGYGETTCEWSGSTIVLRYSSQLNNRALIAVKRALVGVTTLDGKTKFPDVETMIEELERVLLPSGPDVPPDERGWDLTDGGESIPITFDTLADLPPGLPAAMLGAIFRDINDPNRRRRSRPSSSPAAVSPPAASPTTTASSSPPNGHISNPGASEDSATLHVIGSAGAIG